MDTLEAVEQVRSALNEPEAGIVGLADGIRLAAQDYRLHLEWRDGACEVSSAVSGSAPPVRIETRLAVFRAVLARFAVQCNETRAGSVSPYGGRGAIRDDRGGLIEIEFRNTPNSLYVTLTPRSPANLSA